jgi:hypothetical protein
MFTHVAIAIPESELNDVPRSALFRWPVFHLPTTTLDLRLFSDRPDPIRASHSFAQIFAKPRATKKAEPRISFAYIERLVLHLGYLSGLSRRSRNQLLVSTASVVHKCLRTLSRSGATAYWLWFIEDGVDWVLQFGLREDREEPENVFLRWRKKT